jgi:hypothetical protein
MQVVLTVSFGEDWLIDGERASRSQRAPTRDM